MAEDLSINKNKIYSPRYSNNDICRLCLKNETHMEPLFYANLFPNLLLTKKIYDCTSIQIIYERNLPMYVCKLCANKLDDYMRFRERCIANDEFLRNALALFDAGNCLNIKSEDGEPPKPLASLSCGADATLPINLNVAMFPEKIEKMEAEPEDGDGGCEPDDDGVGDSRGRTEAEVKCSQCDFVGATEAALEEHDQCHRETNPYVCNVCTKSFKIRHHLLVHSHTHVESQPANGKQTYGCTKCTKVFVNKGNLLNHIESHLNEKSYTCEICSKSFKYNVQLRLHTRIHTGERPHKCEICNRGFSQLSNLRSHRKTHSKVKPYKCHLCLKSFTMLDNLTAHSLKCLKDKYRCNLCSKSFAKEGNLLSHLQSHSEGVVEKMFKCEMCPKSFKNKEDWKRHVRVHTGEKPYTCDICSKGFAQKANLLSHRKTHLKPNVIFKCEKCERTFKTQKVLDMHVQKCGTPATPTESTPALSPAPVTPPSVTPTLEALSDLLRYEIAMRAPVELQHMLLNHMEKKKLYGKSAGGRHYRCDVCFKGYSQYPSLIKHRKLHFKAPKAQKTTKAGSGGDSAENDDRPYYCDICGKNFKFNRNLKVHMKLHTKANYFKCDKCTNTFEQAEDLKNHLLTHPIDVEKIFNCEFCSNTFKSNEDLKRHRRSHTGERPFKCDTCSKAFTQLSNLRAHTKIHEKRRTYGCNICLMDFTTMEALNLHLKTHQLQLYELCRELKE